MRLLLILIYSYLLLSSHPVMADKTSCTAPKINNQCNSQDVDQSGATGALIPNSALNPIDLHNGNKYLREVDLYAHPEAPDLEIVRHYNAMSTHYGVLGGSWVLSYQTRLLLGKTPQIAPTLQQANGTLRALKTTDGYLERQLERFIWHYHNGDALHFNRAGWLIQIQRQDHAPVLITRHTDGAAQHLIDRISQNQHHLQFEYQYIGIAKQLLLQQIYSSNSGVIKYNYDQTEGSALQRLKAAKYPDDRRVYYHYEAIYQNNNPWSLTGKSIQQSVTSPLLRVRSWVYDEQGKAIFVMAEQPQNWVRIYFPSAEQPNQTRLHSTNGITYVDFIASEFNRIQAVHGATCWACPPPMKRTLTSTQFKHFTVNYTAGNENKINKITGQFNGWPDLELHYDTQGKLTAWQSSLQKPTHLFYKNHKAHRMLFANGDEQQVHYNAQQQITRIQYHNTQKKEKKQLQTQLHRPSPHHLHIEHPNETEKLIFNSAKNIISRQVQRQLTTPSGTVHWHYNERFVYDENDPQRLLRHYLPEGGALHYIWSEHTSELQAIEWENAQGVRQVVIKTIDNGSDSGYEYSNGLQLLLTVNEHVHQMQLQAPKSQQLWWQQQLQTTHGLVTAKQQQFPIIHATSFQQSNYGYNHKKQLVIEANSTELPLFYAWDNNGTLAAKNKNNIPSVQRDASGLVQRWQEKDKDYMLRYNAMRQLDVVYNSVDTVQKNSRNASGFRIYAQHYPQAVQQFFLYDSKKIVAEYTTNYSSKLPIHAPHPINRRYVYLHNKPVGLIDYTGNAAGDLLVMHSDHLGAVHIISDANQHVRWAATYDAFGTATKIAGNADFHFHLRREGQYYDMSTGWHDNLLRTYLPQQGHYLEPDPLGPNPSTQLLGFAKQQPLNHTDPWGLILFSFDGTRYDQTNGGIIYLLHKASQDYRSYAPGPGNPYNLDWDAATSYTSKRVIRQQWEVLRSYLESTSAEMPAHIIPIDIIGFSRGSAIGLHFANQIVKHTQNGLFSHTDSYGKHVQACIQPRFMGFLDSVTQMGILGSRNNEYDFTVSPAWQWVIHGVAMHEYRYILPVHSIGSGDNIQEAGFIGAHGDLGGGYPMVDDNELKPLSDVALQWMLWNARAQGMQFKEIGLKKYGNYAYSHDESTFLESERYLDNYSNSRKKQSIHPTYGSKARSQVNQFMDFDLKSEEKINHRSAKVDLKAYYRWLDKTLNWSPE